MNRLCAELVRQLSQKQTCFDIGWGDRSDPAKESWNLHGKDLERIWKGHWCIKFYGDSSNRVAPTAEGMSIMDFGLENQTTFTFNCAF